MSWINMIQDIRQCIAILKNFERDVEELINKCNEVRKQHIEDSSQISQLQSKIEDLEEQIKDLKNEQGETTKDSE